MANTDLSSTTIGQASINVRDVDQAVAFYRDTLGLRFLFQAGPKMAFFDCGGVRLEDGDVMQVRFTGFGRPLRNPLSRAPLQATVVAVRSI